MAIDQIQINEQKIAHQIGETLNEHYPGHAWCVEVQLLQGVASIRNLNLSGEWGFMLHLDKLLQDPTPKPIINAGGELLERYNISRGEFNDNEFEHRQRNLKGELIGGQ